MTVVALLLSMAMAQAGLSGTVRDTTGGAVPGAVVVVRTASGSERQTTTGPDGRFTFDNVPDSGTLVVRAGGFAVKEQPLTSGEVDIVLAPATRFETVTVTPTRTEERLGNIPASVTVLRSEDIARSPGLVADDVLRRIPSFSLFRRSTSLVTHPTTQGVSLRGIGPSGVSRTLVLLDGAPFNDPFGGWVYWTRVPIESADRIEVVDGSSSSLYGNFAMGGVINIVTSRPAPRTVELKTQYGNKDTRKLDFLGSDVWGRLGVAVDGSVFDTDGFKVVAPSERGVIDNEGFAEYYTIGAKADYRANDRVNLFVRGSYFDEERSNAKVAETNDSTFTSLSGGVRARLFDDSDLQVRVFYDEGEFHSTFFAVPATTPPRNVVRLTVDQNVPTTSIGTSAQWSKVFTGAHVVSAGADFRRIDGDSEEDLYGQVPGALVSPIHPAFLQTLRVSGGTQRILGAFVQDVFTPVENLTLTASVRVDSWRNYDAHNFERDAATGAPTQNDRELPDKSDSVASPRVAAMYRAGDRVSVWGALSSGFRAPTLNELYRQFRVGLVQTFANDQLGPERLIGGEAGVNLALADNLSVRTTFYDNRVRNPVSNVTIGPNLQQRQNLGRTRVRGLQFDTEYLINSSWRVAGAYLFNDAKVTENDRDPDLVGKFLPQVPKHRGSLQLDYSDDQLANISFALQFFSRQYDDDDNVRGVPSEGCGVSQPRCLAGGTPGLPGYGVADVMVSRVLTRNVELFFGVQNLFDEEYFVGTNPTLVGTPRLVNGGLRLKFSAR
jgi:outer membrane receptor protein involved in Fe transport